MKADELTSKLDSALIIAALYGTAYSSEMWEHWSPDDIKHFEDSFRHSPNYKEALQAIADRDTELVAKLENTRVEAGEFEPDENKAWCRGFNEAIDAAIQLLQNRGES